MPVVSVDGPADPRLADYARLSDRDLLASRNCFIAEGRLVVERLIAEGRFTIRSLLLSPAAYRALEHLVARIPDVPVYIIPAEQFVAITGYNIHRGCLASVERAAPIAAAALLPTCRTVVVLEAVTNADNVGGVFRNAAAFAVDAVLLSPTCCDPLYRKAIRTSMAATLRVPFARLERWPDDVALLRVHGFTIVALTPRGRTETLEQFAAEPRPERLALLVGTEGAGLSEGAEAAADRRVRIPIRREVDSLNLAVAVGITLARLSPGAAL
jgi:tRNA G18 (ribose-2'-O)-methylase SpoU